jgi:ribonuclease E
VAEAASEAAPVTMAAEVAAPIAAPTEVAADVAAPVAVTEVPAPAIEAAAPYTLPIADLQALAQGVGLEWVNSDADRVRAVQEAIANEPKPVRVPRERKPAVVLDEGPLILVETRKDLTQVRLPFETNVH